MVINTTKAVVCYVNIKGMQNIKLISLFVCVEVLRLNGVMSSTVNLPNHTFTGQA